MANHTISVTNGIAVVGIPKASSWGTMVWGTDNWGMSSALPTDTDKLIDNALTPTGAVYRFDVTHITDGNTVTPSGLTLSFEVNPTSISNSFTLSSDLVEGYLTDGSGYYYFFTGDTTDGESRSIADWTLSDPTGPTWSESDPTGPTWTEG